MASQRSSRHRLARRSSVSSWRDQPAEFVRIDRESWTQAVERDARDLVATYRELPSIERYRASIDPRCEPAAACRAVLAAFESALAWTDVLAESWRSRYPEWCEAIDAAVGISSLSIDAEGTSAIGQRLGPVASDGLGRYELLECIGRGSSGLVFRAVDHVFVACGEPGEVAVKVIPCADGEISVALREAGNARRVSHGGIARILDAGRVGGRLTRELGCDEPAIFIVQEFVHGQPLWIWRACHPEREAETCQWIIAAIGEAIDACHASGISHGDLTPANVLIEPGGRPRIVDFGGSVRDVGQDSGKGRRHDLERLEAIRRWLLRDLRGLRPRSRRRHVGVAFMGLVGLGIVAALFLPEPSRSSPSRPARHAIPRPAPAAPLPDASIGGYQLFRQDGRVIVIPGGRPDSVTRPHGNGGGITTEPSIESILLDDPGMMTIKISEEKFKSIFGEPTGEVTLEGLAVYRMPKARLSGEIEALERDRRVLVPSGSEADPEASALPPPDRIPQEDPTTSPESPARDALISVAFGEFASGPGSEWRLALARSVFRYGPVDPEERALLIALADRIKQDAEAERRAGQANPGLELLAAMAFLSADVNPEALRLALQATSPAIRQEQRELAEIIRAIATARMGTYFGGVAQSEIEDFARRHGAPGLMRFPLEP